MHECLKGGKASLKSQKFVCFKVICGEPESSVCLITVVSWKSSVKG